MIWGEGKEPQSAGLWNGSQEQEARTIHQNFYTPRVDEILPNQQDDGPRKVPKESHQNDGEEIAGLEKTTIRVAICDDAKYITTIGSKASPLQFSTVSPVVWEVDIRNCASYWRTEVIETNLAHPRRTAFVAVDTSNSITRFSQLCRESVCQVRFHVPDSK